MKDGMTIDLTGRVVVITGGTGALGREMVRAFARCGADVAVHFHRNRAQADVLVKEARAAGRKARAFQADVTRLPEILRMRNAIRTAMGAPHIIVNNAVIQYDWKHVLDQAPADYESQFRSCVLHNVFMAKAFVPDMVKRGAGRVIAINTECAIQSFAGQSAYVSGKRGMDGVLRALAREVGEHQITVNQIAPGWMISYKDRGTPRARNEGYERSVPLKHRGDAREIANLAVFLASDLAGFISGAFIPVCGGNVMPAI